MPFGLTRNAAQRHRACVQLDELSRTFANARAALGAARENNARLQGRLSVRDGSDGDERDANLAAARVEGAVAQRDAARDAVCAVVEMTRARACRDPAPPPVRLTGASPPDHARLRGCAPPPRMGGRAVEFLGALDEKPGDFKRKPHSGRYSVRFPPG